MIGACTIQGFLSFFQKYDDGKATNGAVSQNGRHANGHIETKKTK